MASYVLKKKKKKKKVLERKKEKPCFSSLSDSLSLFPVCSSCVMFVGFISSQGLVKRSFVWGQTVGVVKTTVSSFKWHIAQPTMGGRRGSGRARKRDSFSTSVESTWKRHDKVPVPRNSQYDIKGLHHHPCLFQTLVCQQPLLSMLCTFSGSNQPWQVLLIHQHHNSY